MAENYQDLLKTAEEIQAAAAKVEFESIDISQLQGPKARRQRPPFQPLLDMAMDIENRSPRIVQPKPQPKPQPAPELRQAVQPRPAVAQHNDSEALQQRDLQARIAKEEIGMFADRLSQPQQPVEAAQIGPQRQGEIILAVLSIPDQIAELEKIIDGISAKKFNDVQRASIKRELHDLREEVVKEKKAKSRSGAGKIDRELAVLRDQQLAEAIRAIGGA